MARPIHHPSTAVETLFTADETRALRAVRSRFQQDHDVLSVRERGRLAFLRWLVQTGRLVP